MPRKLRPTLPPHPPVPRAAPSNLEARTLSAVKQWRLGRYSQREAARVWQVPIKRLKSRAQGAKPRTANGGNNVLLNTVEEGALWAWVGRRCALGMHVNAKAIYHAANEILTLNGKEPNATRRWAKRWKKRHPGRIRGVNAKTRTTQRREAESYNDLEMWYCLTEEAIEQYHISPENLYNMDETGFRVGVLNVYYIWTFTELEDPVHCDPGARTLVTALECVSAAGTAIPPYIILPGVEIQAKFFYNRLDTRDTINVSPTRYTEDHIALAWLEHFHRTTVPKDPDEWRIIIIDGHGSHRTKEFNRRASELKICVNCLPPHATHRLQPCDVGVFGVYKHYHQQAIIASIDRGIFDYGKDDFVAGLQDIRERTFKCHTIISAWEKCGIYPHNPAIVLDQLNDPLSGVRDRDNLREHMTRPREGTPQSPTQQSDIPSPARGPSGIKRKWRDVQTPALKIRVIERYDTYIRHRLQAAIRLQTSPRYLPISPTVTHVVNKRDKASHILQLNGIKAEAEMIATRRAAQEKAARRVARNVIAKYGPVDVEEGEFRCAVINTELLQSREKEKKRLEKKHQKIETKAINAWTRGFRRQACHS